MEKWNAGSKSEESGDSEGEDKEESKALSDQNDPQEGIKPLIYVDQYSHFNSG